MLAHFARHPWDAEADPDGSVHAAGLIMNLDRPAERDVPFPAVPAEGAGAFGRSYDGPPGWRFSESYPR